MGSVPNMLRSLLVVGLIMAAVFFTIPRVNSISRPPVDVMGAAQRVSADTGWPVVVPRDLPPGWEPTSVRYARSISELPTWHAGYVTAAGQYIAVEQTKGVTSRWVKAQTGLPAPTGSLTIDGTVWAQYTRTDKLQNSLLDSRPSGELSTLITGTASYDDMRIFIAALKPVGK